MRFYGHAERFEGVLALWWGGREVLAMAYDVMISGYATKDMNNLGLCAGEQVEERVRAPEFHRCVHYLYCAEQGSLTWMTRCSW